MIIGICIGLFILALVVIGIASCSDSDAIAVLGLVLMVGALIAFIFRMFSWIYKLPKN